MADIYEIDRYVIIPKYEDGEPMDAVIAEITVESEGKQMCLNASYDGFSTILLSANPRSELWFFYKQKPSDKDQDELDLIRQGTVEEFYTDEEEILESVYAPYYRELVEMVTAKAIEAGISTAEEMDEYRF